MCQKDPNLAAEVCLCTCMNAGATHALHMRFASLEHATRFQQHPLWQAAFRDQVQPVAASLEEVLLQVCHPPA